jgi:hypothetical protein
MPNKNAEARPSALLFLLVLLPPRRGGLSSSTFSFSRLDEGAGAFVLLADGGAADASDMACSLTPLALLLLWLDADGRSMLALAAAEDTQDP